MDGYQTYAAAAPDALDGTPRSFLFLQGPISSFFDRLGRALIARGHRIHRVNLHFGDRLFWHLPATDYRGRFEDWREFIGELLDRHQVTDLVLHGDRRPYHIVAAEEARERGIPVFATDLGYVRPDWLTLEYDGMTTYSRFPRDPAAIRALAAELPEPEGVGAFHTPFWMIASLDIIYNLGLVFGRLLFPHYRYHSICHPFLEYAGWLRSRPRKLLQGRATAAAKRRMQDDPGSYFLVPLQLSTDFQIRAHSPFVDLRDAVREIIASFAGSGSRRKLVFVIHPLDNGLIGWHRLIGRLARQAGIAERVMALHGGTPTDLLRNAAGVVTVNSTVGVTALGHHVPVKALGNAVFDVAGLTCQAPLDAFWRDPRPPDAELLAAFLRALIGTTQVRGGYYERRSQQCGVAGFVERLERRPYPLAPLGAAQLAAQTPRAVSQTVVVTGVSDALGMALARSQAAPGVQLCLIGAAAEALMRAAEDCRQRGALVETFCLADHAAGALSDFLAAFDRRSPVDLLVAHGDLALGIEREIFGAMDAVAALIEPLRRRGKGRIVLASALAGARAMAAPRAAVGDTQAWLAYGAALRRLLRADGVAVAVVAPGGLALRLAAALRTPALTAANPDRVAEVLGRGIDRRRDLIAVPGGGAVLRRALRLLPARVCEAIRNALLPSAEEIAEAADEVPFAGKSATGD